jgi:hypothetical protein
MAGTLFVHAGIEFKLERNRYIFALSFAPWSTMVYLTNKKETIIAAYTTLDETNRNIMCVLLLSKSNGFYISKSTTQ